MVKSPWSITGRQNFCTSRVQAFCSSGVPLRCCWAKAPDEAVSDNRVSATRNLRIVFLHFGSKKSCSSICAGTDLYGWQARRVTQQRTDDKHDKCGQIYGDLYGGPSTFNNRLISKVYFRHTFPAIGCCRQCGAKLDAATTGASVDVLIPFGHMRPFSWCSCRKQHPVI